MTLEEKIEAWIKNRRRLNVETRVLDEALRRLRANKEEIKQLRGTPNLTYVATFHGDISDKPPIVGTSLDAVLRQMQKLHGYGDIEIENSCGEQWENVKTPDPEDDKIEVWEYDGRNQTARIVWGFWGWHWPMPVGLEQGKLPDHPVSLYELAGA